VPALGGRLLTSLQRKVGLAASCFGVGRDPWLAGMTACIDVVTSCLPCFCSLRCGASGLTLVSLTPRT
jgi:hypothetical protein